LTSIPTGFTLKIFYLLLINYFGFAAALINNARIEQKDIKNHCCPTKISNTLKFKLPPHPSPLLAERGQNAQPVRVSVSLKII
jgi:hypothetical protein